MSVSIALTDRTGFLGDIKEESGQDVNLCYQCRKCTAGCPVAEDMDMSPTQVMQGVRLGQKDMVLDSRAIWLCASCETCSTRCPQEVDIAKVMDAARRLALKEGKAVSAPDVQAFHKSALESMRFFGRIFELGLIGVLKLRTRKFAQDMGLGMRLFLKGKLKFVPEFTGADETRRIFAKVAEIEVSKK